MLVALEVHFLLIFGTDMHSIINTKNLLSLKFDMKDFDKTSVILDIKLNKTKSGYTISQKHYIKKVLKRYDYFDIKHVFRAGPGPG